MPWCGGAQKTVDSRLGQTIPGGDVIATLRRIGLMMLSMSCLMQINKRLRTKVTTPPLLHVDTGHQNYT